METREKNSYVKERLTEALRELLVEKELSEISVQELADRAEVHRVSFYRNYSAKEDILRDYIRSTYCAWEAEYALRELPPEQDRMLGLFDYILQYGDFYRLLDRRGLFFLFKDVMFETIGPKPEYSNHAAYFAAFIGNAIYGWLDEWLRRGMAESAEEMARLLKEKL